MRSSYLHITAIVLLTFLAWSPSLLNGFVWDDNVLVSKNEEVISHFSIADAFFNDFWSTQHETGRSSYYRPLITLSYMFDFFLHGMSARGFHITNLLIHIVSSVILWKILVAVSIEPLLALLCTLVWSVHPGVGESVAWISGRTDSLATLFTLLSVFAAIKAYGGKKMNERWLAGSAAAFGAALLSKESAITTPIIVYLFLLLAKKEHYSLKKGILWFSGVFFLWFMLRCTILENPVGANSGEGLPFSLCVWSLLHVWGNLVWPPFFRIEYGFPLSVSTLRAGAIAGSLLIGWMFFALFARKGPNLSRSMYTAALVAFIPSLLAVILKSMVGSRLVYMSSAFAIPAVALAWGYGRPRNLALSGLGTVALVLGIFSTQRAQLWRSDETLFRAALTAQEPSPSNHLNLGIALYDTGDLAGALEHLRHPLPTPARDQQHYMLGLLFTSIRCETNAEREFVAACEANPGYYSAVHNLAGLLATQGRMQEAQARLVKLGRELPEHKERVEKQLRVIENIDPHVSRLPFNAPWCKDDASLTTFLSTPRELNRLGGEHLKNRQFDMAESLIRAALKVDPWFVGARLNLAQMYVMKNEPARAREELVAILATNPSEERARTLLQAIDKTRLK